MKPERKEQKRVSIFLTIFFLIVLVGISLIIILDWQNIKEVVLKANLLFVFPAILLSILSYLASSFAFVKICRLFDINTDQLKLLQLGFITITIGALLDLGGVGGYAVRISYLKNKGVEGKTVLALSILHTYLGFLMLLILLSFGLSYLFLNEYLSFKDDPRLFTVLALALFIIVFTTFFLLIPRLREMLLGFITRLVKTFTNTKIDEKIEGFHNALTFGLDSYLYGWGID